MTKDSALIERLRDELAALRHAAGQLVPTFRGRELTDTERTAIAEASVYASMLRRAIIKLVTK